jgi:hypothetical protein
MLMLALGERALQDGLDVSDQAWRHAKEGNHFAVRQNLGAGRRGMGVTERTVC